ELQIQRAKLSERPIFERDLMSLAREYHLPGLAERSGAKPIDIDPAGLIPCIPLYTVLARILIGVDQSDDLATEEVINLQRDVRLRWQIITDRRRGVEWVEADSIWRNHTSIAPLSHHDKLPRLDEIPG